MVIKPIPDGYHTITPYLAVRNANKLVDFLEKAFDAKKRFSPLTRPDGGIMHAEMVIGDSLIMFGEPMGESKPIPGSLYLYVPDTDATYNRALKEGATSIMPPTDMFYGDRSGCVLDMCGNHWYIATHIEDVTPEEMQKRANAFMKPQEKK